MTCTSALKPEAGLLRAGQSCITESHSSPVPLLRHRAYEGLLTRVQRISRRIPGLHEHCGPEGPLSSERQTHLGAGCCHHDLVLRAVRNRQSHRLPRQKKDIPRRQGLHSTLAKHKVDDSILFRFNTQLELRINSMASEAVTSHPPQCGANRLGLFSMPYRKPC